MDNFEGDMKSTPSLLKWPSQMKSEDIGLWAVGNLGEVLQTHKPIVTI